MNRSESAKLGEACVGHGQQCRCLACKNVRRLLREALPKFDDLNIPAAHSVRDDCRRILAGHDDEIEK